MTNTDRLAMDPYLKYFEVVGYVWTAQDLDIGYVLGAVYGVYGNFGPWQPRPGRQEPKPDRINNHKEWVQETAQQPLELGKVLAIF